MTFIASFVGTLIGFAPSLTRLCVTAKILLDLVDKLVDAPGEIEAVLDGPGRRADDLAQEVLLADPLDEIARLRGGRDAPADPGSEGVAADGIELLGGLKLLAENRHVDGHLAVCRGPGASRR
jgi:hypothetical protein